LTESSRDLQPLIHESRQSLRSPNRVSAFTTEVNLFNISEVSIAIVSRIRYVHAVLKQQIDLRSSAHSAIVSHNLRGSVNHVRNNKTETDLRSSDSSPNIFTNSRKFHLFRSSVGERFLPKSPTPCPEDINYTPWFSNIKSNANNTPNQSCHQAKKRC
jgi:hypothetical protein